MTSGFTYYICNDDRNSQINSRMYERNIPSQVLQAQFSHRPVSTKYDMMSIIDRRAIPTVPILRQPTYNIHTTFNPGNDEGPWSGYAAKINDESKIKNIFFARQEGAQGVFIPDTTSDMYQVNLNEGNSQQEVQQPFPDLFATPELPPFNPNPFCFGFNVFDNCTRQQVKSVLPEQLHNNCL